MRYILFLISMLYSMIGFGQVPCFCDIILETSEDCCADLLLNFSFNCTASNIYVDQAVVDASSFPPFSGKIRSFTAGNSSWNLSTSTNTNNDILTISSGITNMVSFGPAGSIINLGTVCFEDVNNDVVTSNVSLGTSTATQCSNISETFINCPTPEPWNKYFGDTLANIPNKIKTFTDGVFVVGHTIINGNRYATATKFNINDGSIDWSRALDIQSSFQDLEYNSLTNDIIAVGQTEPEVFNGVPQDNQSLICKINATSGVITGKQTFQHPGRESFWAIKRHPFPLDIFHPFMVLGRHNPSNNAPSSFDVSMIYSIDKNLGVGFAKDYTQVSGTEIEGYRGLVMLNDGDVLFLGNSGSGNNEGSVVKVSGQDGRWIDSWDYPDGIDWYDGHQLPNGIILLSGTRFASNQAIIVAVNPVNMQMLSGLIFQNQSNFREIGFNNIVTNPSASSVDIYLLSREKNSPTGIDRNILNKVEFSVTGATGPVFNYVYSKVIEDGEAGFAHPHLYVNDKRDAIYYADCRSFNTPLFGDLDIFVGSFDLNFTSDCGQNVSSPSLGYIVQPVALDIVDSNIIIAMTEPGLQPFQPIYECVNFCLNCEADFTWTADCCTIQLNGSATGTGPFTYEWDINCDDPTSPDLTGQSLSWTFNAPGTYNVCLKITDTATGCMATVQKQVTVTDNPPTLTCPPDIIIPTDPGLCTATYQLVDPMATDDCTTMFVFGCTMSGATTGPAISPVTLNKGITTITCATEDSKGQLATCTYNITVEDQEPPVITCPAPIVTSVAACDGGANVTFLPPTFADNCPMVTYTCSHQSGDFFPCGTTMVTCTATDMAGNQTTCSFPVTVNCACAEVDGGAIECTDVDDQFAFSFTVIDLTGAGPGACTINAISTQTGVTISNPVITGTGPAYTISGLVSISPPPVPTSISITINVSCVCPDGAVHDCSFTRTLATPCCKEISVDPQEVCKTGGTVQIPLLGCNNLYDVQQVRWYIADAPCPPASWTLIKVSNGCADLNLSPIYHNGDVCVYAEVDMGPDAGPCTMLTSNIATITLCEPVSCNLSSDQAYCWVGSAITPAPLTVNLSTTACLDDIRWFDPQGNPIPAADGQLTYQPPALSFTLANTECSQSYTYRVEVSNECGTQSCSATIRLDNEDAPVGTLTILPPDTNPLCYGEDVILEYEPECAGTPERWDWFLRLDAVSTYTPLTANGDRNPLYYSNRLYADTWVKVEKTNGVCPTDEIEIFLDVIDPITINTFTAQYDSICSPTVVDLSVDFNPNPADPGCSYTVTWFRNGQVIQTTSGVTTAPVNYTYTGAPLAGNYYCVVENSCCPGAVKSQVVTLDKPMEVYVAGPCFRCNCDTITLNGIVLNPLNGFNCTYQWYDGGVAIPGETGIDLVVDYTWDGPFTFEVTCTDGGMTCVKDATYTLLQCGDRDLCVVPPQCCESEMTFHDAVDDFMIDVNGATATISNTSLLDCDELSIDWGDGSTTTISASDLPEDHDYDGSGSYDVQIDVTEVDDNGTECFRDTVTLSITGTTGIQQPNGLKIFPNPTEGIIQVELPEGDHLPVLEVFNLQGKLIQRKEFPSAQARYQLDIRSLPAGVYILRSFSQEGKILIEQVIKQ